MTKEGGEYQRREADVKLAALTENVLNLGSLVKQHKDDCKCYKEDNKDKMDLILERLGICPEASHIEKQNGKLDDLIREVSALGGSVKFWGIILAFILGVMTIAASISTSISTITSKKENRQIEDQFKRYFERMKK